MNFFIKFEKNNNFLNEYQFIGFNKNLKFINNF